jgi:hypothetical protein
MPPKTIKGSIKGSKLHGFKVLTVKKDAAPVTMRADALAKALAPETASALTPAAAKLTKADLVALNADPKKEAAKRGLTVTDLNSVKKAFATMRAASAAEANGGVSVSVTACCCPCCCAASVQVEVAVQ